MSSGVAAAKVSSAAALESASEGRSGICPDRLVVRALDSWSEVEAYRSQWTELVERARFSAVFQTYEWNAAWWRAFGEGHTLNVLLCLRGDTLVGVAPMMIRSDTKRGRAREICFIGCPNDSSDYLDFIIDSDTPEALDELTDALREQLGPAGVIHLSHFPTHSPNYRALLGRLEGTGARFLVEDHQPAPCRKLGDEPADRKAANKASLRRRYNYFRKNGELRFHRCHEQEEILGWMDDFFRQHVERRAMTHAPSQFLDPRQQAFFRDLVGGMLAGGWLRFDVVLFNDRPLAFHLGFEYRGRFIWYKPTFDVSFRDRSPGEVLMKFLLEDAIERQLEEFDFTVGSEPFKYRFANEVRYNDRITVYRSRLAYWRHRVSLTLSRARQELTDLLRRNSGDS
jgi:CelD/BcsL family acetyltransferase involved in cellulose biosynthesis